MLILSTPLQLCTNTHAVATGETADAAADASAATTATSVVHIDDHPADADDQNANHVGGGASSSSNNNGNNDATTTDGGGGSSGKQPHQLQLRRSFDWRAYAAQRIYILSWIRQYDQSAAIADAIAGVTLGLTMIPQAIAYAALAGLPSQYGLYSAFVGECVYLLVNVFCSNIQSIVHIWLPDTLRFLVGAVCQVTMYSWKVVCVIFVILCAVSVRTRAR